MNKSQKVLIAILGIAIVSGVSYHMYQDRQNQIMQQQILQQQELQTRLLEEQQKVLDQQMQDNIENAKR